MKENGQDEQPHFGICDGLDDLILLMLVILDTRLVILDSLDGYYALAVVEETAGGWRVRQYPKQAAAHEDCDAAEDDEHPLVSKQVCILDNYQRAAEVIMMR